MALAAVAACGGSQESGSITSAVDGGGLVCNDPRCTGSSTSGAGAGSGAGASTGTGAGASTGSGAGGSGSGAGGAAAGGGTCGNGVIESGEQCEPTNLNGQTCATATMGATSGGSLKCSSTCTFDTSSCGTSGNPGGAGGAQGAGGGGGRVPPGAGGAGG